MKALVAYFSLTGNTRKVAKTIYNELECEKDILAINETGDLDEYDVIFLGFPVWLSAPPEPVVDFLNKNAERKNIALFVTHASPYETELEQEQAAYESMLQKCREYVTKGNLAGFFHCRGEFAESAALLLLKSDNLVLRQFAEKRHNTFGHPDEDELEVAKIFVKDVIRKISLR